MRAHLAGASTVGIGCLIDPGGVAAAEAAANQTQAMRYPLATIFTFLFLMLGPFKIIGPFLTMTMGADTALARQIALRSTLFASLALLIAAVLGESFLDSYGIPLPILSLSAGIILFLVALQGILQQFAPPTSHGGDQAVPAPTPRMSAALTPLAFPTIVTPYGIAMLVVFLALTPGLRGRMAIGAIVLTIMLLNLFVMGVARRIPPVLLVLLQVLGAVLGVIQVAFGLRIIYGSLKALGAV
jgi:multiple antibiotic resistance protein